MSDLVRFLLLSVLCSSLALAQDSSGDGNQESSTVSQEAARGLASSYEPEDKQALRKNSHIFMGIYKNYKSTYLGNKTTSEYKKRLRDRVTAPQMAENETPETVEPDQEDPRDSLAQEIRQDAQAEALMETQTESPNYDDSESLAAKKRRKRKRKDRNKRKEEVESETDQPDPSPEDESIQRYNVGPGLNVSLDMSNDIVHVKLDGENLKEIIGARWLTLDNSEEGRGKKYDMITKVLPLFILPFLIQSAIVPFLVTKLKLLLVKSILVGKLAIFLLIISAIKNGNKMVQSYEVPSYWAGEPSRRSELAAAASSAAAAYNGYRVEGKPTTWIS
ncbi:uncharacterized protein LOC6728241 [Drosophila simulans]|uniref:GD18894 n=1 Tax=Drosophila simulans TaxID=7240 RepID=B4R1U1_DROSI|nr:uncharacterized protein LOC6728241 [Drosophila simulans]EDX13093.1 GD18894 [Drosophila simulans]KMZ03837.1 uncharacterized protein Dsimw501_GD18894 [Drosophila simulans]